MPREFLRNCTEPKHDPDVPYVPTTEEAVKAMLKLADVKPSDIVYDLGCGDGQVALKLATKWHRNPFISVDPHTISHFPEYTHYLNARKDRPHALFIHWPEPNASNYDIEALAQNKAKFAILVVETSGIAGGIQLLKLLHRLGLEDRGMQGIVLDQQYHSLRHSWHIVQFAQTKADGDIFGAYYYTCVLLEHVENVTD